MKDNTTAPDDYALMEQAKQRARFSPDLSRKVGCVIADDHGNILSEGWNTLPEGCQHTHDRLLRPQKYLWTEHAERNAIYLAARRGVSLEGNTIYVPWYPCFACARAIVSVGLDRIVAFPPDFQDPKWGEEFRSVKILFEEAGIEVTFLEGAAPTPQT
jgi:dCMP deaminase